MYNFNQWKISDKQHYYIGSGAHWEVYRLFLEEEQTINGFKFSQFIYKQGKNKNNYHIPKNIEVYKHIKKTNLPTLAFYFPEKYNEVEVIIGEDLNANNLLFVSPNNARNNTREDRLIRKLQGIEEKEYSKNENAEEILVNNKISEILNFVDFINLIKNDMEVISHFDLLLCEDVFFFGTYKNENSSELFYKIADFETIAIDYEIEFSKDLVLRNTRYMLCSLWEYVEMFVDIIRKKNYQDKIENEIRIIQKELGEI